MNNSNLKSQLYSRPDLQPYLFRRGFIVSQQQFDMNSFPFYGNWNVEKLGGYYFMTHSLAKCHHYTQGGVTHFLLGHCYNPFTMEHEEAVQLTKIAEEYEKGEVQYWAAVNELTGVFVMGWFDAKQISFITDPSGMQSAYYGKVEGNFMITSHPQIIGDLYNLEMDEFVKELIAYKWYPSLPGAFLPADISPFCDIKRIVPNHCYLFRNKIVTHNRFYPNFNINDSSNYQDLIVKSSEVLRNNMKLIALKWSRPAISLTGGIDSNTTFAAANSMYDKYESFSYLSAHKESIDVNAANIIADKFGVKQTVYTIPECNTSILDFDIKSKIISHNSGYIAPRKDNEVRKRIYLADNFRNDVEVKSWVSETFRAAYHHRYRRRSMPKMSAKLYRNIYKIFLFDRSLVKKIDALYETFIRDFQYAHYFDNDVDIHFWEVTWGSWGGTAISEMQLASDITIPYNNRYLLNLMMSVPIEKRLQDTHHKDIKQILNKELYDMNINVVNMYETNNRGKILNMIFTVNMLLSF